MPRITVRVPLRWGDMDAFGHVNNATTVQLLEQARVSGWFAEEREVVDVVVARNLVEYLAPIPYSEEPIEVEMWVARVGGSSIEVHYEVFSVAGEARTLTTRASTLIAFLDGAGAGPRRLSPEERRDWSRYLEEPLEFRR